MIINSLQRHIRLECRRWLGLTRLRQTLCKNMWASASTLNSRPITQHNLQCHHWMNCASHVDRYVKVSLVFPRISRPCPSIHPSLPFPHRQNIKKKRKKSRKPKPDDGKSKVSEKEFGTWFSVSFSTLLPFMTATTDPFIQQYCTSSFVGRCSSYSFFLIYYNLILSSTLLLLYSTLWLNGAAVS